MSTGCYRISIGGSADAGFVADSYGKRCQGKFENEENHVEHLVYKVFVMVLECVEEGL